MLSFNPPLEILQLAEDGEAAEAEAASALIGALNLASDRVVPLILGN